MDKDQVLAGLNFGRVDAETDDRFESCFIGTEMLRQVLVPKHSLVLGSKGSGKSASFRLLSEDQSKIRGYFPKNYKEVFTIPVYGLQNEDYVPGMELRDLTSHSVDDFRYFWLLYIGLKTVSSLVENQKLQTMIAGTKHEKLKAAYKSLNYVMQDLGLTHDQSVVTRLKHRVGNIFRPVRSNGAAQTPELDMMFSRDFRQKTGMSTLALMDNLDTILRETNCAAWILLDKLDLLFIDDFEKLKAAITGLIQLLVEYNNRFKNIHFKIFLRNDIYRQLRIVNKSHLISYTTDMKWKESLLLKLLASRAIAEQTVREYVSEVLGEPVDMASVINGSDDYVLKVFYTIFDPSLNGTNGDGSIPFTHVWIMKHLTDGMGNIYPRELILLGNYAVEKQRELNREARSNTAVNLISGAALKEAFSMVSVYRCDTYLYSEFPHLAKHFDVFRGSDSATFQRDDLNKLFERFTPNGDEAIRAMYDAGLLAPMGRTVDSSLEFKVPLLYRVGLGMVQRKGKIRMNQKLQEAMQGDYSMMEME